MLLLAVAAALASAPTLSPTEAAALGKRALGLLTQYSQEGDAESRALASAAWGQIGNPASMPLLRAALKDKNVAVRIEAAVSLAKLGDEASARATLEAVIAKEGPPGGETPQAELKNLARDKARAKAISRLSEFGGEQAVTLFEKTLEDRSAAVREATALALAKMGLEEFAAQFLEAAQSKDESVRAEAARSLGAIGRAEYFNPVKDLAADSSADVRLAAVEALSNFDATDAAGPLQLALKDSDARVRAKALWVLSKNADADSKVILKQELKMAKVPEAALKAEAGLALRGETIDLGLAERSLRAKDADLKALALDVLKAAPGDDALLLLKRVMDDELDPRLKASAATAIVRRLQKRKA